MKQTQAATITVFLLILTVELSFIRSLVLNLAVLLLIFAVFLYRRRFGGLLVLIVLPLLPSLSTWWSIRVNGSGPEAAWILATRCYAFAAVGLLFAFEVDFEELLLHAQQRGLPHPVAYGILVVVHAMPEIRREIRNLREAARLKGTRLSPVSPLLYLKTIMVAFDWRTQYIEAMAAHGYDETAERSCYVRYCPSAGGILVAGLLLILLNAGVILL